MNTQQQALLGILGGMGPLATVDFLNKLTRLTAFPTAAPPSKRATTARCPFWSKACPGCRTRAPG